MIKKSVLKEIDKAIKNIWLHNICTDYGNGFLIKEFFNSYIKHHLNKNILHTFCTHK